MVDDYINRHTIQGMMSKTAKPFDDWAGFWKNSKQVVVFDDSVSLSDFPLSNRISWGYLPSKENLDKRCSTYSSILVLSEFDEEFFNKNGIRNGRQQWTSKCKACFSELYRGAAA